MMSSSHLPALAKVKRLVAALRPLSFVEPDHPSSMRRTHIAVIPPSTNNKEPVTYDASLDARKRMHAATSSALPGRFSMVRLAASSLYWARVLPVLCNQIGRAHV